MIGEAFRREGESFKPLRAGAPILDPATTWRQTRGFGDMAVTRVMVRRPERLGP
jgi:hypothetical protein